MKKSADPELPPVRVLEKKITSPLPSIAGEWSSAVLVVGANCTGAPNGWLIAVRVVVQMWVPLTVKKSVSWSSVRYGSSLAVAATLTGAPRLAGAPQGDVVVARVLT